MDFYIIPPIDYMQLALMGDRIYCLAHLYVQDPMYRAFILQRKKGGWHITLDNSAAERELVTEDVLLDITEQLMPNEVIAPDYLFDKEKTQDAMQSFIEKMKKRGLHTEVKIFGCPQGTTEREWIDCYLSFYRNPDVDVIGLSKIAVPKAFGNKTNDQCIKEMRRLCVAKLDALDLLKKPIHCLGMGDPKEFSFYKGLKQIRSTDSCYSVLAAMNDIDFSGGEFKRIPTPKNYFYRSMTTKELELAEKNILWMRQALH